MNFLKNHPFAVEAFFDSSLVLTFAVPKEHLQGLILERMELDLFQGKWAFVAMAMVQTSALRPKGFPKFIGNDFFLIGYRIFVRYTNLVGKRLRGLYILRSETDKKKMEILGNIFTHYNYTTTDILQTTNQLSKTITSKQSGLRIKVDYSNIEVQLPKESPFLNWTEARKFAGPLPHTFTYNTVDRSMLIIEGVRNNWRPEPIAITEYQSKFIENLRIEGIVLASAFEVRNVPYYWKKGLIEKWK